MAASGQRTVIRSPPPSPAPVRTVTEVGKGAARQAAGSPVVPVWKLKSYSPGLAPSRRYETSSMIPLMPAVKDVQLAAVAARPGSSACLSVATAASSASLAAALRPSKELLL